MIQARGVSRRYGAHVALHETPADPQAIALVDVNMCEKLGVFPIRVEPEKSVLFIGMLTWDAIKSFWYADGFGIGVGSLVLTVNVVLLAGYTFGCHSLRHLVGGGLDRLSRRPLRHATYRCVGCFNRRHMLWAWGSLFSVGFADLYVRLCSMGVWSDVRIL